MDGLRECLGLGVRKRLRDIRPTKKKAAARRVRPTTVPMTMAEMEPAPSLEDEGSAEVWVDIGTLEVVWVEDGAAELLKVELLKAELLKAALGWTTSGESRAMLYCICKWSGLACSRYRDEHSLPFS
jgi:hypothetical protein